jgi:predicted RNase H-like HicB family nuclease
MDKYSINIHWSDEDECFVALVPEFPGLSTFGDTREEAAAEAQGVIEAFIEIHEEEGYELPEPKALPSYSGQLRLRLPKDLHAALAKEAENQGVSLNTHMVSLLSITQTVQDALSRVDKIESRIPEPFTIIVTSNELSEPNLPEGENAGELYLADRAN